MHHILFLLFRMPSWATFILAGLIAWGAVVTYQGGKVLEAERETALAEGKPAPVALREFRTDTDVHAAKEVHVVGEINGAYNYELVRRRNGIVTSRHFMYVLFDTEDATGAKQARAAIVLKQSQKDIFAEKARTWFDFSQAGSGLHINGVASQTSSAGSLVASAFRDEGLTKAENFVFIRPFLTDRETALAPKANAKFKFARWMLGGSFLFALLAIFKLWRELARRAQRGAVGQAMHQLPVSPLKLSVDQIVTPQPTQPDPAPVKPRSKDAEIWDMHQRIRGLRAANAEQDQQSAVDPARDRRQTVRRDTQGARDRRVRMI